MNAPAFLLIWNNTTSYDVIEPDNGVEVLKLGTQKLVEAIAHSNPKPSVLVSASAIEFYGTSETARVISF